MPGRTPGLVALLLSTAALAGVAGAVGPVCTSQLQAGPVIVLPVCTPEVEPPAPPAAPRADAPLLVDEAGDGIEGDLTVAGRPGVGTSSPSAALDVRGPLRIADGTEGAGRVLTSGADGSAAWREPQGLVPPGMVAFFAGPCPAGWEEYLPLRGRVLVGLPAGGTVAGASGAPLADLEAPSHAHAYREVVRHTHPVAIDDPGHTHRVPVNNAFGASSGASGDVVLDGHFEDTHFVTREQAGITASALEPGGGVDVGATDAAAHAMPYLQLRACQAP